MDINMNMLTRYPSRKKTPVLTLGSFAFPVVGMAMIKDTGALADTYGMKAEQLADLLNQRRRSALDAGTAVRWAAGGIDLPSRWPVAQAPVKGE
jgi:hypothetical protein